MTDASPQTQPNPYASIQHSNPEHKDWFVVNWCVANTCTYSCSYCPEDLHSGSKPWPKLDVVLAFIDKLMAEVHPRKVYFEFTGGEVTVWPDFIAVCEHATRVGARVGLISNGSRSLRWWEEHVDKFDNVCLSYHPEHADKDAFLSLVKLTSTRIRTHVNVMMLPQQFNECYAFACKVIKVPNISIALQPLIVDFGSQLFDYSESQKRVMANQHELLVAHIRHDKTWSYYRGAMRAVDKDDKSEVISAQRFVSMGMNNWKGWKCYSGVEQIVINMDGSILIGWCNVSPPIGTLEDFKLPVQPVMCTSSMCHCNFDIMSTKVRTDENTGVLPTRPVFRIHTL